MKGTESRSGTQWDRYMARRIIWALGALVSMLVASGAGTHWH
jgi:hypothetical protein